MRKRTKTVSVIAAALVGISCFSMPVFADGIGDRNENEQNINKTEPTISKNTVVCEKGETGNYNYQSANMQDTSTIITDTTDKTTLNKDEMTGDELKSAIKNWIESLWTETPDVDVQGYEDGNITRVLKSHMNIIPYKEIIGQQWVPCDPDDIGAVRFENGGHWNTDTYTLTTDAWRIEGFTGPDVIENNTIPIDIPGSTKEIADALGIGKETDTEPTPDRTETRNITEVKPGDTEWEKIPTKIEENFPYRFLIQDFTFKKLIDIEKDTTKEEPRYYWDRKENYFWIPGKNIQGSMIEKIMEMYSKEDINIVSTSIYEELIVDKVVVGQTVKEQWINGTEAWTVHKLNEETKQWEYVDSYKSTRKDKSVDIYFNEAGTYLIKEFQSCRRTISKRYYYHWKKTLVLDDFGLILGVRENVPTPERVEKEDLYVDTNEIVTQELRDLDNSFIQPIEERGLWMVSPNGIGTSATIRRVE